MGNSLRCCLACVLPCGALDVVRIVHLTGQVDEYGRPVSAGEILAANPNHVLSKPCSQGAVRHILIISPESELKRGHIYFLIPSSSLPEKKKRRQGKTTTASSPSKSDICDDGRCSSEIMSEKIRLSHRRHRSCGRATVWRPHLHSINEDP